MTASLPTPADIEKRAIPEPNTGCWLWLGAYGGKGRPNYKVRGFNAQAARASFVAYNGYVPEGLDVDHLCKNPHCVNPDHLEAVTHAENCRRWAVTFTHCPNGHPYSGVNNRGWKKCWICDRERQAARRKAAACL